MNLACKTVPNHLKKKRIRLDSTGLEAIRRSLETHYFTGWRSKGHIQAEAYARDLEDHLTARLERDRRRIIPWLDHAAGLCGKRILEVGCGTGSSTVALAEQGAEVTGIDVDEGALSVARDRCRAYGVNADLRMVNAQRMGEVFSANAFDMILFFACLEHMTIPERLISLRHAWEILPGGGCLAVIETPNRLWYFDGHTSQLPFFHWLPDELAFQYSRFSPRENFRELYREWNDSSREHFLRRGRGFSYHEMELAIAPIRELRVICSLSDYEGMRSILRQSGMDRRYRSFLQRICPGIPPGFLEKSLDLAIQKLPAPGLAGRVSDSSEKPNCR